MPYNLTLKPTGYKSRYAHLGAPLVPPVPPSASLVAAFSAEDGFVLTTIGDDETAPSTEGDPVNFIVDKVTGTVLAQYNNVDTGSTYGVEDGHTFISPSNENPGNNYESTVGYSHDPSTKDIVIALAVRTTGNLGAAFTLGVGDDSAPSRFLLLPTENKFGVFVGGSSANQFFFGIPMGAMMHPIDLAIVLRIKGTGSDVVHRPVTFWVNGFRTDTYLNANLEALTQPIDLLGSGGAEWVGRYYEGRLYLPDPNTFRDSGALQVLAEMKARMPAWPDPPTGDWLLTAISATTLVIDATEVSCAPNVAVRYTVFNPEFPGYAIDNGDGTSTLDVSAIADGTYTIVVSDVYGQVGDIAPIGQATFTVVGGVITDPSLTTQSPTFDYDADNVTGDDGTPEPGGSVTFFVDSVASHQAEWDETNSRAVYNVDSEKTYVLAPGDTNYIDGNTYDFDPSVNDFVIAGAIRVGNSRGIFLGIGYESSGQWRMLNIPGDITSPLFQGYSADVYFDEITVSPGVDTAFVLRILGDGTAENSVTLWLNDQVQSTNLPGPLTQISSIVKLFGQYSLANDRVYKLRMYLPPLGTFSDGNAATVLAEMVDRMPPPAGPPSGTYTITNINSSTGVRVDLTGVTGLGLTVTYTPDQEIPFVDNHDGTFDLAVTDNNFPDGTFTIVVADYLSRTGTITPPDPNTFTVASLLVTDPAGDVPDPPSGTWNLINGNDGSLYIDFTPLTGTGLKAIAHGPSGDIQFAPSDPNVYVPTDELDDGDYTITVSDVFNRVGTLSVGTQDTFTVLRGECVDPADPPTGSWFLYNEAQLRIDLSGCVIAAPAVIATPGDIPLTDSGGHQFVLDVSELADDTYTIIVTDGLSRVGTLSVGNQDTFTVGSGAITDPALPTPSGTWLLEYNMGQLLVDVLGCTGTGLKAVLSPGDIHLARSGSYFYPSGPIDDGTYTVTVSDVVDNVGSLTPIGGTTLTQDDNVITDPVENFYPSGNAVLTNLAGTQVQLDMSACIYKTITVSAVEAFENFADTGGGLFTLTTAFIADGTYTVAVKDGTNQSGTLTYSQNTFTVVGGIVTDPTV